MTPFSLAGLLIALTSSSLGLLVLFRSPDRRIAVAWSRFAAAVAIWGVGTVWIGRTSSPENGLLAWKLTYGAAVVWIAPFFYSFVRTFLGLPRSRMSSLNFVIGALVLVLLPSSLIIRRVDFLFGEFFYMRGGILYTPFFVWWFGVVIAAHIDMIRTMKAVTPEKRRQIQYFFLATAFGYTGAAHSYLPKIGVDVYPWGVFGAAAYTLIMG
jgi:hypothetical protein